MAHEFPEGTKRVFTSVDVRNLDIVDKGANLQVLVYKKKDKDMATKETPEKPELVETEAVKSEEKTVADSVEKSEAVESKEAEASAETTEVQKAEGLSEADVEAIAKKLFELQKSAEGEQEKAPEKSEEVVKSEEPKASQEDLLKGLSAAITKAVEPLAKKISDLEEARGGSAAADDDEVEVEKSATSVFTGIFPSFK